jgi:putative membrane-bound dehydrogenase-like protein
MTTADFRFDPRDEAGSFEVLSGGARFGNSFDDWGNRFICNIRNPIQHVVLPRHYLARNPHLAARSPLNDVAESGDTVPVFRTSPPEPWRVMNSRRLANDATLASPRSETVAAGYMTSASGLTVYRGSAYPKEFYGSVFLGEVAGNLIHHQVLTPRGVTFTSQRSEDGREFLTSTDNWFRPVNFVNAPDGTLHVLDMYRETIEHPWSIPDDIKAQLDLESGRDRGRIYRLAPIGFQPPKTPRLGKITTRELVALLTHADSWWRETAHRLLLEQQDRSAVAALRQRLLDRT